jgi:hypothetical protein
MYPLATEIGFPRRYYVKLTARAAFREMYRTRVRRRSSNGVAVLVGKGEVGRLVAWRKHAGGES